MVIFINFLKQNFKQVIAFSVFLIIVSIFIFWIITSFKKLPPVNLSPVQVAPTKTPSPIPPTLKTISPFLKTMINITTAKQVQALPSLKSKDVLSDGKTQYNFQSPTLLRDNVVVVKNDLVVFERAITVEKSSFEHPKISSFINNYGKPDQEFTGSEYYGEFEKTYVFSTQGFALVGNPFTDEVAEVHIFVPVPVDQYVATWGKDIKTYTDTGERFGE